MLNTIFATKLGMTQAWTKQGKRLAVTRLRVDDNLVVDQHQAKVVNHTQGQPRKQSCLIFEIGYGNKKLKNVSKPLAKKLKKGGFSSGVSQVRGVKVFLDDETDLAKVTGELPIGSKVSWPEVLEVGDAVKVRGKSKGRGFAGVIKRHGFKGGPRTHGQSDRERAPGSIGSGTDPGRVWKGKKMPGHYGNESKTVSGLTVVHVDPENNELWISGPVPGHNNSIVRVDKIPSKSKQVELNFEASGILQPRTDEAEADKTNKTNTKTTN